VDLTFHRPSSSVGGDVRVRLSTDIKTLRFRLSDSDRKPHVFHGVEELIDKRPLYVKAIGVSASPDLPAAMLKVGYCYAETLIYAYYKKLSYR